MSVQLKCAGLQICVPWSEFSCKIKPRPKFSTEQNFATDSLSADSVEKSPLKSGVNNFTKTTILSYYPSAFLFPIFVVIALLSTAESEAACESNTS